MRKNIHIPALEITGIADKGKAVGRHDGLVVFVEGVVPGDVAEVQVFKKSKGVLFGRMVKLVTPSPDRAEPFCAHFGVCGGCKWQYLTYEAQLRHKQNEVEQCFARIGKVKPQVTLPILGAPAQRFHRNKLEFAFSNRRWFASEELGEDTPAIDKNGMGFHLPGLFDKVLDLKECHLQAEPSDSIRQAVHDYAREHALGHYDIRGHEGYLRGLMIRTSSLGQVMLLFMFGQDHPEEQKALFEFVLEKFKGQITTLCYCINQKTNDTIYDQEIISYFGQGFITERLGHCIYKIGPKSFFQTNTAQATNLYTITREFAALQPHETVYDLYTGTGSIACFVAADCKHVVGVEEVAPAIEDAKVNAEMNGLSNTTFYAGDVKDILSEEFIAKHGKPDVVITDPPRIGMHPNVVATLLQLEAPRMVYVSCNPATQARDLALLSEKYDVLKSQAVDMFPHTHHIENVVLLKLKG